MSDDPRIPKLKMLAMLQRRRRKTPLSGDLTGNRRFRKAIEATCVGGITTLVLQVEYTEFVTGREDKPGRWVCKWRDAVVEDVSKGELA